MKRSVYASFISRVKVAGECLVWIGATVTGKKLTYGQFYDSKQKRTMLAHRFAYEFFKKPIPKGLTIDHICRNTLCVNPDHLRVLTLKENILCGNGAPAINARKTHCPQGHEYNKKNTKHKSHGRVCRYCENEYLKKYNKRRRAEKRLKK